MRSIGADTTMIDALTQAFNTIFRELVVLFRSETGSSDVKSAIKRDYKKFDSDTSAHIVAFRDDNDTLSGFPLCKTAAEFADSAATAQAFQMHECLVVLCKLQALSPAECVVNVVLDAMANKDTSVVEGVVLDKALAKELMAAIENIDDDTRALLVRAKPSGHDIMTIARDVSKSIDIESIMRNGMDPNSPAMQEMLGSVSRDIQGRIDSGDVDQDALMKEATAMLASLGGNGMGDMMKAMMGAVTPPKTKRGRH
jgi:hypothetical protein